MNDALEAQWKGDRLMKKNSTVVKDGNKIFKEPAADHWVGSGRSKQLLLHFG